MQSLTEYLTEAKKIDVPQEILDWFSEQIYITKAPRNWAKFLEMREDGYAPSKMYANKHFKYATYTEEMMKSKNFEPLPELPEGISKSWFNSMCDEVQCMCRQYPSLVLKNIQNLRTLYLDCDTVKFPKDFDWIEEILDRTDDDTWIRSYGMIDARSFTKEEVKAQFYPRLQKLQNNRKGAADFWFNCADDKIYFTSKSK